MHRSTMSSTHENVYLCGTLYSSIISMWAYFLAWDKSIDPSIVWSAVVDTPPRPHVHYYGSSNVNRCVTCCRPEQAARSPVWVYGQWLIAFRIRLTECIICSWYYAKQTTDDVMNQPKYATVGCIRPTVSN